jgi:excisionase family DNA binding protein
MTDKVLYSRHEAASALSLNVSSIDVLILRGMLKPRRQGRRVLIPKEELEKFARRERPRIWPDRVNGRWVRAGARPGVTEEVLSL